MANIVESTSIISVKNNKAEDPSEKLLVVKEKNEKTFLHLEDTVNAGIDEVEECIHCINSNLPIVVEKIEELREIEGQGEMMAMAKSMKVDIEHTITTMHEIFDNSRKNYLRLVENFEISYKNIEKNLEVQSMANRELSLEGKEDMQESEGSIIEGTAKMQSKFGLIDRGLNAIQESLTNLNGLIGKE